MSRAGSCCPAFQGEWNELLDKRAGRQAGRPSFQSLRAELLPFPFQACGGKGLWAHKGNFVDSQEFRKTSVKARGPSGIMSAQEEEQALLNDLGRLATNP